MAQGKAFSIRSRVYSFGFNVCCVQRLSTGGGYRTNHWPKPVMHTWSKVVELCRPPLLELMRGVVYSRESAL